jgi:ABC transport system ATP-binding/permease protein
MNIILAEERGGRQLPEISFSKDQVLVGRDAGGCDISFSGDEFLMVSRKHAELRWQNGRWFLKDLNSSYGTFLDGDRVTDPQPLSGGNRIQFGTDGPVLRVIWFEATTGSSGELWDTSTLREISSTTQSVPSLSRAANVSSQVAVTGSLASGPLRATGVAQLDFLYTQPKPPFKLTKPSIWLGRDPECDIVFDASAAVVSRKHAEVREDSDGYLLVDNGSFNGTLVNRQRITAAVPLYHNDEIQLGVGGPVLRFNSPTRPAPTGASLAGHRSFLNLDTVDNMSQTMIFKLDKATSRVEADPSQAQLLMSVTFAEKREITIGRDDSNDIKLDGLQISKHHARLTKRNDDVLVEDLNSTNGVYVNGKRVNRGILTPDDSARIGSFLILVNDAGSIGVFDTRSKHRIDVVDITKEVRNRGGGGRLKLLDSVSLSIQPNEFVGILGPSGAGKSTLIKAMNGVRPATTGNVLINNLDLYEQFDSLKQAVGYVPQQDIIHRELSVYRTLYYVAKLRLSRDISKTEIDQIINEVLDVTGLTERRNMPVGRLSGGQRKRVSIAVELVTKPSVIFLDEPTSGLDPGTEERIMKLFRQIAESGRTVVMTTHAMENIKLFDKIVILMRGKLVFYGPPDEALRYLGAASFKELFDRLEAPVSEGIKHQGETERGRLTEQTAEGWRKKFLDTPEYKRLVEEPLADVGKLEHSTVHKKGRLGLFGAISQWLTLSRRYFEVLMKDRLNLFILLGQAPLIALLTFYAMGPEQPRDFLYFVVALVAVWFGTSVAAREIIRERQVYRRERMFNLGILPYVGSKLTVLSIIVGLQCVLLFVPLKLLDLADFLKMPGERYGSLQFAAMLLTAAVGIALGLLVSALVRTSEMATSLVPLILIPQILFSGLIGEPSGMNRYAGLAMPAAWSFDTMKRYSTLDTLEPEGANPRGKTKGLGLYKFIETENEKMIAKAKRDLDDLRRISGQQYQDDGGSASPSELLGLGPIQKLPADLSDYIAFLDPWMDEILNQVVLVLMFGLLVITAVIVLRLQDIV